MSLADGSTIEGVIQSYDVNRNEYRMSLFNNDASVTSDHRQLRTSEHHRCTLRTSEHRRCTATYV